MISLLRGDCLELMKDVLCGTIDLVVTSPPYDNLRTYNGTNDFTFEKFKLIASELTRVLKTGGVIVWIIGDATIKGSESGSSFKQALYFKEDLALNLHDTMIYLKDSCAFPEQVRYYPVFEYMFIFSKGVVKTFNPIKDRVNKWAGRIKRPCVEYDQRGKGVLKRSNRTYEIGEFGTRYNVWKVSTGCGKSSKEKLNHPAIFPIKLAEDHVSSWSNEGDTVMDPFMGSGTTGVACKRLDRKFIGIERVPEYFEIAKNRINQ